MSVRFKTAVPQIQITCLDETFNGHSEVHGLTGYFFQVSRTHGWQLVVGHILLIPFVVTH